MARAETNQVNKSTKQMLKEHRDRIGEVVLVKITDRTTIELPASLSRKELDARIAQYKSLHKSKI
jgi:predicted outer membrane protein